VTLRPDDERTLRTRKVPHPLPSDDFVLTFKEWCAANRISERNGRRILAGPDGPTVTMLSARRMGITVKNNRIWQQSRERGASVPKGRAS
jgi:hypothetical protein